MNQIISPPLAERLQSVQRLVAFTGAGVSAESGVPTFRGTDGIWAKFKPEELATMGAFLKNPDLVWQWYAHRRKIIAEIQPNPAHRALVAMEEYCADVSIITQNIDNLHRRAGSKKIYELHGNIERNVCVDCGMYLQKDFDPNAGEVPRCTSCGGLIRPDVVWFGEMLPEDAWENSVRAASLADVFLSIGTSGVVYPAASLPWLAKKEGAFLVEVNPEVTPMTDVADVSLRGPAGTILPIIVDEMKRRTRACETS
jgi:NAD-dependent deacetylase